MLLELMRAIVGEGDDDDDRRGKTGEGERLALRGVPVWAQDPVFTEIDRKVLEDMGISMLPVPDAVAMVDERTLLFVPFVDAVVLLPEILNGKDPALYVGSDIEEIVERLSERGYTER
jgi:SRR1